MNIRTPLSWAILLGVVGTTVALAISVANHNSSEFMNRQDRDAQLIARDTETGVGLSIARLATAASSIQGSPIKGGDNFRELSRSLLAQNVFSQTLLIRRLRPSGAPALERRTGTPIRFGPLAALPRFDSARRALFPVIAAQSREPATSLIGIEHGSFPVRRPAMAKSVRTGAATATPTTRTDLNGRRGVFVYEPFYRGGAPISTVQQRRTALIGFMAGVIDRITLERDVANAAPPGSDSQLIPETTAGSRTNAAGIGDESSVQPVWIADEPWLVVLAKNGSPGLFIPALIALGGILLALLFGILLVTWSRRERRAVDLASQRVIERDQAQQTEAEANRQYRLLAENSSDMVSVHDPLGNIRYVSSSARHLFGWEPVEMVDQPVSHFLHPTDAAQVDDIIDRLDRMTGVETIEFRLRRANGSFAWVESTLRAINDPETGEVTEIQASTRDIEDRKRLQWDLERLAGEDSLTGLKNRRRLEEEIGTELARTHRRQDNGAFLLVDVDRFKLINDSLGHSTGDAVIRSIATILGERARESDILARLGGDEFAIALPETTLREAMIVADSVLESIKDHRWPEHPDLRVTVSIGISTYGDALDDTFDRIVTQADAAMYAAKEAGRNCVFAYDRGQNAPGSVSGSTT